MVFIICNDTLYGGAVCNATIGEERKQKSLTALLNAAEHDTSVENVDTGITKEAI
jgi:hypothetical protein